MILPEPELRALLADCDLDHLLDQDITAPITMSVNNLRVLVNHAYSSGRDDAMGDVDPPKDW